MTLPRGPHDGHAIEWSGTCGQWKTVGAKCEEVASAVIGAGYFGRLHTAKLAANPKVELAAVANLDAAREVLAPPMYPQLDRKRIGLVCEALRGAL